LPPEPPSKPPAPPQGGDVTQEPEKAAAEGAEVPEGSEGPPPPLPPPALEHPDPTGTLYLDIEEVVANARVEDIPNVFQNLRSQLAELKGSRAEQGSKVLQALDRTEELFLHLIQVREQMEAQKST
jgi:hypothetical protein